jgi:hypothetical protein
MTAKYERTDRACVNILYRRNVFRIFVGNQLEEEEKRITLIT